MVKKELVQQTFLHSCPESGSLLSQAMRLCLSFILTVGLVFSHTSCSRNKATDDSSDSGHITITYWCDSNPISVNLAKILVEKWNSSRKDIFVKLVPIPSSYSSEETILAAIAGGTTPDLSENIWSAGVPTYSSAGGMVKLDELPGFWEHVNSRVPGDMLEGVACPDGHYYALPYRTNPVMVMYNLRMFEEAGVTAPLKTYSQIYEAAAKITADTDGDGQIDRWMGYTYQQPIWWQRMFDFYCSYIAASGGKRLLEDNEITFDNEAAVKVMAFFRKMFEKGYYPRTFYDTDPFTSGDVATIATGPWHITYVEEHKPEDLEYDVMPLPVPDDYVGPVHTFSSTHCLGIFSTTEHPNEVWEFVKFLTSPENDLELLKTAHQIPVRINLLENEFFKDYFDKNPLMLKFAQQLPYCPAMDTNENFKEILDAISQEYEACAIYGRKSPQQAIKDAVNRTKVILEWNSSR